MPAAEDEGEVVEGDGEYGQVGGGAGKQDTGGLLGHIAGDNSIRLRVLVEEQ